MNPRLLKEWRMLRTETIAGVAAATAPLLVLLLVAGPVRVVSEDMAGLLRTVAVMFFCVVVCFLAAGSFGAEFQHRTIGLLLVQPGARFRVWREKTMCLWTMAAIVGAAWLGQNAVLVWFLRSHAAAAQAGPDLPDFLLADGDLLNAIIGFVAVVAATPFFTLSTRSTLVGAFLGLTTPFLPLAAWMAFWLVTCEISGDGSLEARMLGLAETVFRFSTPAISAWFCWLGWRHFRRLELQDLSPAAGASLGWPRKWGRGLGVFLVCRPHGVMGNLIRKELCLLRPLAVITAVFTLGWLAARLAATLMPREGALGILAGLAGTFMPLAVLLAGAIPFGEEKQLGVAEWQLTLPVRVGTQWVVKLFIGGCTAAVLGFALPLGLACLTLPESVFHRGMPDTDVLTQVAVLYWVLFVTSFWAATLLRNTIQAVLAAVLGLVAAFFCILAAQQLATADGGGPVREISPWVGMVVVSILLLMQSRRRFRTTQPSTRAFVLSAVILLATVFVVSFCAFALPLPQDRLLR